MTTNQVDVFISGLRDIASSLRAEFVELQTALTSLIELKAASPEL